MAKVIITCAVTGGAHTPGMLAALPGQDQGRRGRPDARGRHPRQLTMAIHSAVEPVVTSPV